MKKILALVLALVMVLMVGAAFAADDLKITVEDTNPGQTYKIYKLFDAESVAGRTEGDPGISYKIPEGKAAAFEGNAYFDVDGQGNVTAKAATTPSVLATDAFRTWAESFGTEITAKEFTGDGNNHDIEGLSDGYYFITTTTGTLITVTSIAPSVTVEDKNPGTDIDKEITDSEVGTVNATTKEDAFAQIGKQVDYSARFNIANGARNYVFKDIMSDGLTVDEGSVRVYLIEHTATGVASGATPESGFGTPVYANATGNDPDITIAFTQSWIHDNVGKDIVVTYTAHVNASAVSTVAGNPNLAQIWWGDTNENLHDEDDAKVYNAQISVIKTKNNKENEFLEGAGFKLYQLDGTAKKYYKMDATEGVTWISETETVKGDEHFSNSTGNVEAFNGLADGTYYLEESTVPPGYNKAADVEVTIAANDYSAGNLVQTKTVNNNSGAELPSTGGIGTTIFYILGGLLVVGAAVILVARRKAQD